MPDPAADTLLTPSFLTNLVAAVAAVAGVIVTVMLFKKRLIKFKIGILDIQSLTDIPQIPNFRAAFYFGDREVENLQIIRVCLLHAGGATVIGTGIQKNLVREDITVKLTDGYDIQSAEIVSSNDTSLKVTHTAHAFSLAFTQWRKTEKAEIKLYVEQTAPGAPSPNVLVEGRPIIDGNIIIEDDPSVFFTGGVPPLFWHAAWAMMCIGGMATLTLASPSIPFISYLWPVLLGAFLAISMDLFLEVERIKTRKRRRAKR